METKQRNLFKNIGVGGELYIDSEKLEQKLDDLTLKDYRMMRDSDGQIQMILSAIYNTILSAGVKIVEDPGFEATEQQPVSEEKLFLEQNLLKPHHKQGMQTPIDYVNRVSLRAFEEGFRVFELVYRIGEDNKIYLDKVSPRAGIGEDDLELVVNDKGEFQGYRQRVNLGANFVDVRVVNDSRFKKVVKSTYGKEYGSNYGRPGIKAAWYHYDKVHKAMYLSHIGLELGSVKLRHLKVNGQVDESEVQSTINELSKVGTQNIVALNNENYELVFEDVSDAKTLQAGKDMIDLHYSLIAKSVLAQFIDLGSNISQTGSRAVASSQTSFFKNGLQTIATTLVEDLWAQITPDLIDMNFNNGLYPHLKVNEVSNESAELVYNAMIELVKKGNVSDAVQEAIEKMGKESLKLEVSDDDITEYYENKKLQPENNQPQINPSALPQMDRQINNSDIKLNDDFIDSSIVPENIYPDQKRVKFADINRKIDDVENRAQVILAEKLGNQRQEIIDKYLEAARSGQKAINGVNIQLQEDQTSYSEELILLTGDMFEFGKVTAANELNESVPTTDTQTRNALDAKVDSTVNEQTSRLMFRMQDTANQALLNETPENQSELLLEQIYNGFWETVLAPTIYGLVPFAMNLGRKTTFTEYSDKIFAFRYTAILDQRTTDYCRNLNGTVFQSNDPEFSVVTPPNHFGCRSMWTAITKDQQKDNPVRVTGKPEDLPLFAGLSNFKDVESTSQLSDDGDSLIHFIDSKLNGKD